jgi:hypothetical protein
MDRFRAIAPIEFEPALWALCRSLPQGTLYREWPWSFHAGKSYRFETPLGTTVYLAHATHFGCLVVLVDDDCEGVTERIRNSAALIEIETLVGPAVHAASERDRELKKIGALCALASVQSFSDGVALPELEVAAGADLDDRCPAVRLAALRAIATLPIARALSLLEGREDPENPELGAWRDHYRAQLNKQE